MNRIVFILLCCLLLLSTLDQSFANTGYVTKVVDGDSLVVRGNTNKKIKIRLYGIDSPEWNQKNAKLSSKYLKKTIYKKKITYKVMDYDRYGRVIALVKIGDININKELVRKGYVWVYSRYCKEKYCKEWKVLQKSAKKRRIGLWQEKDPISPWRWKRKK